MDTDPVGIVGDIIVDVLDEIIDLSLENLTVPHLQEPAGNAGASLLHRLKRPCCMFMLILQR